MATKMMRARFPLVLLLGIFLFASVSVTYGALAYWETENPGKDKCLQSCSNENDAKRNKACHARCNLLQNESGRRRSRQEEDEEDDERRTPRRQAQQPGSRQREEEEEQGQQRRRQPWQQREGEEEPRREERRRRRQEKERDEPIRRRTRPEEEEEDEDEDEEEQERGPWGRRGQEQERRRREKQREERQRRRGRQPYDEDEDEDEQSRRAGNNPFHFPRSRYQTLYRSEHGWIRVLQRFNRRSNKLDNLQNYRLVEIESRPQTLVKPKHADADSFIVVQQGS